jgi:hypothetical protein
VGSISPLVILCCHSHTRCRLCRRRIKAAEEAAKEEKQRASAQVDALVASQQQSVQQQREASDRTLAFLEKYLASEKESKEQKQQQQQAPVAVAAAAAAAPASVNNQVRAILARELAAHCVLQPSADFKLCGSLDEVLAASKTTEAKDCLMNEVRLADCFGAQLLIAPCIGLSVRSRLACLVCCSMCSWV